MSETIALVGKEQVAMWVLLSRRSQLKLQLKGLPTKGLVKWCKANIEGCENARTAKDCVIPVEYAIAMAGGPQDFSLINVHVMKVSSYGFIDKGVYPSMAEVEANPSFVQAYHDGNLEIIYTWDEPREPNGQMFVPEGV